MAENGSVAKASTTAARGLIYAGGTSADAFLSFRFDDCDQDVQNRLAEGDIPPNPGFPVTFDITLRNGSMVAVNIQLQ